jgi:hypothetical protein
MTVGAVLLQEEVGWGEYVPVMIRKSVHFGVFLLACGYVAWRCRRDHASKECLGDDRADVR